MHLMASAPARGIERSGSRMRSFTFAKSGQQVRSVGAWRQSVPRDDLRPPADPFLVEERPFAMLATDALAERVPAAGSYRGLFVHLPTASVPSNTWLITTAKGLVWSGPRLTLPTDPSTAAE